MTGGSTIFALSSGPAPAGVAVIRLSGPQAGPVLLALTGRDSLPPPRKAVLCMLRAPEGERLDSALGLWFPGPASFTGEDVVELQCHGGAATIAAVLDVLGRQEGCRMAEAGEFSRRAFANDRMDLTEVEGLSDLIAAETEAQRRLALRQTLGEGRDRFQDWTDRLVKILAAFEAAVDFPEDDLPDSIQERNESAIRSLIAEWEAELAAGQRSARIRDGVRIAILGPPNAGKSSLLNRLAGREAAIVSSIAGTTRDVIEVRLDFGGYLATLADTAGLRSSSDAIEEEGIRRASAAAQGADIRLMIGESEQAVDALLADPLYRDAGLCIGVRTKVDHASLPEGWADARYRFGVSSVTGEGIDPLVSALAAHCAQLSGGGEEVAAVRARHRGHLTEALSALERSLSAPEAALAGEDIRLAVYEVGRITGRVDVEAILDVVFSEFCIGK